MKKHLSTLSLLSTLLLLLSSCAKDVSDTAEHLLTTVPSSASMVATINLPEVLSNAGCKVDNNDVTPAKNANISIKSIDADRGLLSMLASGESGVEITALASFMDAGNLILTGIVDDTKQFRQFVSEANHKSFSSQQDVDICGNVAVKGDQFWVFPKTAFPDRVIQYTRLSKAQSYVSEKHITPLLECKSAINGRADIVALINQYLATDISTMATVQLALGALFNDAQFIAFDVSFNNAEMIINAQLQNAKGAPARLNLQFGKISDKDILSLGGSANGFFAININEKLVKQLADNLKKAGGMQLPVQQYLGALNGTCAFKFSSKDNFDAQIKIGTGDPNTLIQLLSEYGTARRQGDVIVVAGKNSMTGRITDKMAAKTLNGAIMGLVADPRTFNDSPDNSHLSAVSVVIMPDNNSAKIQISAQALNLKQKFLQQFL